MSAYIDRESVLWAIEKLQKKVAASRIRKEEILPALKCCVIEMEAREHVTPIAERLEDFEPAIPYSVLSRKTWRCGICEGKVWLTDSFCKHCGAKLEGEVVKYGQWHGETAEGV